MKHATFLFVSSRGFSGMAAASQLIVDGLRHRGWAIRTIGTPAMERDSGPDGSRAGMAWMFLRLLSAWIAALAAAFSPGPWYINLGLSRIGLFREGLPLLVRGMFGPRRATFISLHGNLFTEWNRRSFQAGLFRVIARAASVITVLGPTHRSKLIALGVPPAKVVIMDNTCVVPAVSEADVLAKHGRRPPVSVLFLSSLIETKGYPEFVEALALLAASGDVDLEAVLCGRVLMAGDGGRFPSHEAAQAWIDARVEEINRSRAVRLKWIPGASGRPKEELFRTAQVFVLPSRYRMEAQPLVLLEAMASGCAVVTSRAGEIPNTVSPETAVLLEDTSPARVAQAILDLAKHPERRRMLAQEGWRLFQGRYALDSHLDRWERLLTT